VPARNSKKEELKTKNKIRLVDQQALQVNQPDNELT
jgi:hypothetical protein